MKLVLFSIDYISFINYSDISNIALEKVKEFNDNVVKVDMKEELPFSENEFDVWMNCFKDFMITGGMPRIVNKFIEQNNFSGILQEQIQIQKAYEEDILKYATGLDKSKIKNVYSHIPVFLARYLCLHNNL